MAGSRPRSRRSGPCVRRCCGIAREASGRHLDDIVKELKESTCACSDRASVEQELTEFLRRADATDVRTRVEARLAAVRSGGADVRFRCHSG